MIIHDLNSLCPSPMIMQGDQTTYQIIGKHTHRQHYMERTVLP